ncbi:MAG: hypothetical protein JXP72_08070 [Coriobacteriia bacterium]|nr:hypothetical protein [Coriobacteriia bacterium]
MAATMMLVVLAAMTLPAVFALSPAAAGATWPYVIHEVTSDTLYQEAVVVSGPHLVWNETRQIFHDDGTVTHTPYVGQYIDRLTGRRTTFDPGSEGGGVAFLQAGEDWAVYVREHEMGVESTATIRAWNMVTGARVSRETSPAFYSPPVTDGTLLAWQDTDSSVIVAPLGGGEPLTLGMDAAAGPAINQGRVCWAQHIPADNGETRSEDLAALFPPDSTVVWVHDTATGAIRSAVIERFSALGVDMSGSTIIITGETPDYRSHLYVWDTRTSAVSRVYSAYPDYLSAAYVSGDRVVMNVVPAGGGGQVRALDLITGALTVVSPPDGRADAWSFDEGVVGIRIQHSGGTFEAAWCDLDERPAPDATDGSGSPTPVRPTSSPPSAPQESAEPTDTPADEDTATPAAEVPDDTPEVAPEEPGSGDAVEPEPDRRSPLAWVLGGLAGLAVLGTTGLILRRRGSPRG